MRDATSRRALHCGKLGGRATQFAGDVERVAGAGRAAAQGATGGGRADQHDVCQHQFAGRLGGVAAGQRDGVLVRQTAQAGEESLDPARPARLASISRGQREREEGRQRTRAHGGQIAKAARQRPVADRLRRMPVAAEVAAFEGEVGGDEEFVASGRAQDGAVVADAEGDAAREAVASAPGGSPLRPDAFDQRQFAHLLLHREPSINPPRIAGRMRMIGAKIGRNKAKCRFTRNIGRFVQLIGDLRHNRIAFAPCDG